MPGGLCVVCKRRSGWRFGKACSPCVKLVDAEGTREQYGLPPRRKKKVSDAAFVAQFNKLTAEGLSLQDIGKRMGYSEQTVKNRKVMLVDQGYTFTAANAGRIQPEDPLDRSTLSSRANEHGQGGGITGCRCVPCLEARRNYQRDWAIKNRDKRLEYSRRWHAKEKLAREAKKSKPS